MLTDHSCPLFIATGRRSHCRPARRHGKPWSPPATIAATETIKGPLLHVSALQSVAGEEEEVLTMTMTMI